MAPVMPRQARLRRALQPGEDGSDCVSWQFSPSRVKKVRAHREAFVPPGTLVTVQKNSFSFSLGDDGLPAVDGERAVVVGQRSGDMDPRLFTSDRIGMHREDRVEQRAGVLVLRIRKDLEGE